MRSPKQARGPAISRINDALRPGEQVVVTCRTKQYGDVLRPQGGIEVALRGAAAVQLRPLDVHAVQSYLSEDAAGPAGRARWGPVLDALGTEAPVGQALTTPLMVGLARAMYNPRPGELAATFRDPAELCSPTLADRIAVESLLFDAFIPAAYRHNLDGRWKAQDAERWLVFLARHLEFTIAGPDLAWWQLPLAVPSFVLATGIGAMIGVVTGVWVGVGVGVVIGIYLGTIARLAAGVLSGVAAGVVTALRKPQVHAIRTQEPSRRGMVFAIARVWLALRHRLPWRFMGFLEDAHGRGVFRQSGAVYQFRYIELQQRLARRKQAPARLSTWLAGPMPMTTPTKRKALWSRTHRTRLYRRPAWFQ